MKNNIETMIVS